MRKLKRRYSGGLDNSIFLKAVGNKKKKTSVLNVRYLLVSF